jgi:hypothetical protein
MKKVILTVAAFGLAALMATEAQAGIFGRGGCDAVYVQPAPAAVPTAAVPAQPGVRAFSYQPVPAAPVMTYRAYRGTTGGRAYTNATNKALGRGF